MSEGLDLASFHMLPQIVHHSCRLSHMCLCCLAAAGQVRCVRADMASRVELQASDPALIFYPYKTRPALGGWLADERASSFVVVSHDGSPQLLEAFRLKELEEAGGQQQQAAAGKAAQQQGESTDRCSPPCLPHYLSD